MNLSQFCCTRKKREDLYGWKREEKQEKEASPEFSGLRLLLAKLRWNELLGAGREDEFRVRPDAQKE